MKMQTMNTKVVNKQAGFTLVELIIVIVILGILAVVAAPRFLNLQGDANASTLEGLQGSIRSGMQIVNGKAIINSTQKLASSTITVDTGSVPIVYGYPAASTAAFEAFLDVDFATDNSADFNLVEVTGTPNKVIIFPNSYVQTDACRIEYSEATNSGDPDEPVTVVAPLVTILLTGC